MSCFRSRHKSILNQSILLWNHTIGTTDTIDYPQDLQNILTKLRGATNIHLPGFPEPEDVTASSPVNYFFAQLTDLLKQDIPSPLNISDSSESEAEILQRQDTTPNKNLLVDHSSPRFSTPSRVRAGTPVTSLSASKNLNQIQSVRRGAKTTPKAKLRHDNSQIQFAAIESSPMAEDHEESQRLTDRQKEVKERQKHEAALFPEIRSSPRGAPPVANRRLPTFALNSGEKIGQPQEDEVQSPAFPPDSMMNDFLGSSPTPSSSRKMSVEPYSDEGPPSSPPLVSSHLQVDRTNAPSDQHQDEMDKVNEDVELIATSPRVNTGDGQRTGLGDDPVHTGVMPNTHLADIDNSILSDTDVFVDAPTDRTFPADPTIASKDLNSAKASARDPHSSRASLENDEVTAQIMGEIARASSQQSKLPHFQRDAVSQVSKKRIAKAADGSRKRKKGNSPTEHRSSAGSSGEVVADCVLIVSRPSSRDMNTANPFVKQEPIVPNSLKDVAAEPPAQANREDERVDGLDEAPVEGNESDGKKDPVKRGSGIKGEQDASRRSRRRTRTSSRLSDVATSSPLCSEASFASQEQAETDTVWVYGPRGSRWAYVPATEPVPAVEQPALAQSPAPAINDNPLRAPSPRAMEVTHAQPRIEESAEDAESAEAPAADSILDGFRSMLERVKNAALRPEEERAVVTTLFETVKQVHEAGRRYGDL